MGEYALIIIGAAFVNNVVLAKFLGLCPFVGVSNRLQSAAGLGGATAMVLTLACVLAWVAEHWVLRPLEAPALRSVIYIFIIAVAVQATELALRRFSPVLYRVLGMYVPLITTNCAVLGVALMSAHAELTLLQAAVFGLASAAGFTLVLLMFAAMRERIVDTHVPALFRGVPIALISAGIMSLAFLGLRGIGAA